MTEELTKDVFEAGYNAGYRKAIMDIFDEGDCRGCLLYLKNEKKKELEKLRQNEKEMYNLLQNLHYRVTIEEDTEYWDSEIKELLEKVKINR